MVDGAEGLVDTWSGSPRGLRLRVVYAIFVQVPGG